MRVGNPDDTEPWEWICGFYLGSRPGEIQSGTSETFAEARADFGSAWKIFLSNRTEADFQAWRDQSFRYTQVGKPEMNSAPHVAAKNFRTKELTRVLIVDGHPGYVAVASGSANQPYKPLSLSIGGHRSFQGCAASKHAEALSTSASSRCRPTICSPIGRPSSVHPAGTDAAG
jgi:hypothetical protein